MIKHQNLPKEDNLWRKLHTILQQFPHKEQVQFALFCAEEANSEASEGKECIRLVKAWLKDSKSVTNEELRQATSAAYYAAHWSAASFSANAAYATYYATWTAAWTAADAASYATSAAWSAAAAARLLI